MISDLSPHVKSPSLVCIMQKTRPANPTLSMYALQQLSLYEEHLKKNAELQSASIRNYISDVHHFMAWFEALVTKETGNAKYFNAEQITATLVKQYKEYLQYLLERKSTTINRHMVSLKRYFSWLSCGGYISQNPALSVKSVPQSVQPARHITDSEENALVMSVRENGSIRDQTIIILMLHTGLRVEEICRLERSQLKLSGSDSYLQISDSHNRCRKIPLNSSARTVLQAYLTEVSTEQNILFASRRTHKGLTRRGVSFIVAKYVKKAGLEDISPHDLRHRFGYKMAEKLSLDGLAKIMGHESLNTTMIYAQSINQDLERAIEAIAWK